ncbi:hypothetical protein ACVXZY_01120 [Staphylococcus aureus]
MAFLVSTVLTKTILKNDNAIFIVELPTYRVPSIKTLWRSTWEKARALFVKQVHLFLAARSSFGY